MTALDRTRLTDRLPFYRESRASGGAIGIGSPRNSCLKAFGGAALAYLNSTACVQAAAKTPIIRTLLEFQGIDEVVWEIDGEIFDAWDA